MIVFSLRDITLILFVFLLGTHHVFAQPLPELTACLNNAYDCASSDDNQQCAAKVITACSYGVDNQENNASFEHEFLFLATQKEFGKDARATCKTFWQESTDLAATGSYDRKDWTTLRNIPFSDPYTALSGDSLDVFLMEQFEGLLSGIAGREMQKDPDERECMYPIFLLTPARHFTVSYSIQKDVIARLISGDLNPLVARYFYRIGLHADLQKSYQREVAKFLDQYGKQLGVSEGLIEHIKERAQ